LGDEIFVASESSISIAIYSFQGRQNFEKQASRSVSFHELTTPPQDIAGSEEFRLLFVADCGGHCVWQLGQSSGGHWKVEGKPVSKVKLISLSVNAGRLLVVEQPRLTIFDIGKKELKPTLLPKSLQAEHALETSLQTFVVCGQEAGNPSIVEVNRRGGMLHVCDPCHISIPCYLSAFSTDEADLLVVDRGNQRIVLLNSGLEIVRILLDGDHDGVWQPRRVVKSGYFLVGHSTSSEDSLGVVSLYGPHQSALQPLPD